MTHDVQKHCGLCTERWILVLAGMIVLLVGCGESESIDATNTSTDLTATADTMTLDRVLQTDDRFSTLVAAFDSTGLDSTLASDGPFTLFAPPDAAFEALPDGTVPVLLTERTDRLRTILARHVVEGHVEMANLADSTTLTTLDGDSLRVRSDTAVTVGPATVVDGDITVANGRIHVIDSVLPPPPENE